MKKGVRWNPVLNEAGGREGMCDADFYRLKIELAENPLIGERHVLVPQLRRHIFFPKISRELRVVAVHYVVAATRESSRTYLMPHISNIEQVHASNFQRTDREFVEKILEKVEEIQSLVFLQLVTS